MSEYGFIPNPPQDFHKEVSKHHQQHRCGQMRGDDDSDLPLFVCSVCVGQIYKDVIKHSQKLHFQYEKLVMERVILGKTLLNDGSHWFDVVKRWFRRQCVAISLACH